MSEFRINLETLQAGLDISPFQRWLGLQITEVSDDGIALTMPWRDEIVSNPQTQTAHGGVLAALIDLTGLYALIAAGSRPIATADLRIDYHRPAVPGDLRVEGRPVRIGRSLSVAEAQIFDVDGNLLTSGRGAYPMSPPKSPEREEDAR